MAREAWIDQSLALAKTLPPPYASAMTRHAAGLFAAMLFLVVRVHASETADSYETALIGEDGASASSVGFSEKGCEEECHAASLRCITPGGLYFDFADVPSQDAAAAITSEKQEIVVQAGSETFAFPIEEMRFVELTGSWEVSGHLFTDPSAFTVAVVRSSSFNAMLGGRSLTLPVTADVKSWASACVK